MIDDLIAFKNKWLNFYLVMDILFSISSLAFKVLFYPKRTVFFRPTLKFKPSADPLGVILGLGKKFVKYFDDKPKRKLKNVNCPQRKTK